MFVKSLKIAFAALFSTALAGELGLQYSATAGIITILSIGNTKRETLRSAVNRGLAFVCALVIAALFFTLFGYNLAAFALYLFCFALLCLWAGWGEAIAMASVLVTHFLAERSMALEYLLNETAIFVIGTAAGIVVNLHLHPKGAEFEKLSDEVDAQIRAVLRRMSLQLAGKDSGGNGAYEEDGGDCFERLDGSLAAAHDCAVVNHKNTLFRRDSYEIDYIAMRGQQANILRGIHDNIQSIEYLPAQAAQVAELLSGIEQDYHRSNHVEGLLGRLEELLGEMKEQRLPVSREEFEARAILFYILMQLESLLEIKRNFMKEAGNLRYLCRSKNLSDSN